jgi:hypothetical protein
MKSEAIVIAEYRGLDREEGVSFFSPPCAVYRIEKYLKGPPLNRTLPVKYEFHEKLPDVAKPENWQWNSGLMPKKGSKWIIFIEHCNSIDGMYETYHGAYGRQAYTEHNLDEIQSIIQQHRGQAK